MSGETPGPSPLRTRVFVQLREDLEPPWWTDELDQWLDGQTSGDWGRLQGAFAGVVMRPVFADPGPIERLSARSRRLREDADGTRWRNLAFIDTRREVDVERVQARVAGWPVFTFVDVHGPFGPATQAVLPTDDDEFVNQWFLEEAPKAIGGLAGRDGRGVDAVYAWRFPGGDGSGVGFADVEAGWARKHPDLPAPIDLPIVFGEQEPSWKEHGTEMLGVVIALDSEEGVVGIVPAAGPFALASISEEVPEGEEPPDVPDDGVSEGRRLNIPAAIAAAAAELEAGDVLLIEVEKKEKAGAKVDRWPVEVDAPTFLAIQAAVDAGIVVVEAAGNGAQSIDGKIATVAGHTGSADSGAIIVGAAYGWSPYDKYTETNFGTRIDCWGWASAIRTTRFISAGNFGYWDTNATSGASAIVAGVCVAIQGMRSADDGAPYDPHDLRKILRNHANGQKSSSADLGILPSLRTIADDVLELPFPWVREDVDDDGSPSQPSWGRSPDLIVKTAPVADPDAAFGPGSDTRGDRWLSDVPQSGGDNVVYVRVFNRGKSDAEDVQVLLYDSAPATFATPALTRVIGTVTVPLVPKRNPGPGFSVSEPLAWSPSKMFRSLGAVVGIGGRPPYLPDAAAYARHGDWLRHECRALATRMLFRVPWNPVPAPFGPRRVTQLPFRVGGNVTVAGRYQLELDLREASGRRVGLRGPPELIAQMRREGDQVRALPGPFGALLVLAGEGRVRLGTWSSPAGSIPLVHLVVDGEAPLGDGRVELSATQIDAANGRRVGSVTWRLEKDRSPFDRKERRAFGDVSA